MIPYEEFLTYAGGTHSIFNWKHWNEFIQIMEGVTFSERIENVLLFKNQNLKLIFHPLLLQRAGMTQKYQMKLNTLLTV